MSSIPRSNVEWIANREFDGLSGTGAATLQRRDVTKDINDLLDCASVVTRHRNERVAHLGINPSDQFAGLEDLDRAIDKLGQLFNKYSMLLRRHSCDLFPTIQYDWAAIFRVPWERRRP